MPRINGLSGDYDLVIYLLLSVGGQFELLAQENCSIYLSRIIAIGLDLSTTFVLEEIANNN